MSKYSSVNYSQAYLQYINITKYHKENPKFVNDKLLYQN